jgi:hypothetical protein
MNTFILTIFVTAGVFFQVPAEYSSYEKCVYHGERVMEERRKDFQPSIEYYVCEVKH